MIWRCWIYGGLLLVSVSAFAVSRVGGGTLSNDQMMFHTPIPQNFAASRIEANGDLLFDGPVRMAGAGDRPVLPQVVDVFMLSNERADLANLTDREQVRKIFLDSGWTRRQHPRQCVDWYEKINGRTMTATLVWGDGRGVIFTGLRTSDVFGAIESMATNLEEEVCGWR